MVLHSMGRLLASFTNIVLEKNLQGTNTLAYFASALGGKENKSAWTPGWLEGRALASCGRKKKGFCYDFFEFWI
jgi:hypothetical protein